MVPSVSVFPASWCGRNKPGSSPLQRAAASLDHTLRTLHQVCSAGMFLAPRSPSAWVHLTAPACQASPFGISSLQSLYISLLCHARHLTNDADPERLYCLGLFCIKLRICFRYYSCVLVPQPGSPKPLCVSCCALTSSSRSSCASATP